ncbi:YacL family protein [Motiliproteus sp. MSK22-1]|uniref:UPF0231 family protein n=1 Tax=Motiliproteus sp. MSK22-1 TaxID=1897630 RepID=UPI0009779526|nr:YacL family protein [Motiliproteus sp. MSK22-1]OMH31723.1 hypothetical protein BGP75_16505 [Motiliproteus sp. MSK22-1]
MDYEFTKDFVGSYVAHFPMGHEALGSWLTTELGGDQERIQKLYTAITELQQQQSWDYQLDGAEYRLQLTRDEAVVQAHTLFYSDDELTDNMDYYDSESFAQCGLDDFKAMLTDWSRFVGYPIPETTSKQDAARTESNPDQPS